MARFRFRLSAVLRMRRLALEQQRRALAAALRTQREAESRLDLLRIRIGEQAAAARASLSGGSIAIEQALWDRHELSRLRRAEQETILAIRQQHAIVARERQNLTEAHRRVRVLERLEETRRAAFDEQENRIDSAEADERSVLTFARTRPNSPAAAARARLARSAPGDIA